MNTVYGSLFLLCPLQILNHTGGRVPLIPEPGTQGQKKRKEAKGRGVTFLKCVCIPHITNNFTFTLPHVQWNVKLVAHK